MFDEIFLIWFYHKTIRLLLLFKAAVDMRARSRKLGRKHVKRTGGEGRESVNLKPHYTKEETSGILPLLQSRFVCCPGMKQLY